MAVQWARSVVKFSKVEEEENEEEEPSPLLTTTAVNRVVTQGLLYLLHFIYYISLCTPSVYDRHKRSSSFMCYELVSWALIVHRA